MAPRRTMARRLPRKAETFDVSRFEALKRDEGEVPSANDG